MRQVAIHKGYTYYMGWDDGKAYYNIAPSNQPAPNGGYYAKEFILAMKKVPDLFY